MYTLMLPDDVSCNIALYADNTTVYSEYAQASDLWQKLELAAELESDLWDTVDWDREWLVDFNPWKTLNLFCLAGLITVVLLMWKWMALFLRKSNLLRCCVWLSLSN